MRQYDYLIVGCGLFGSVVAEQLTGRGKTCIVIDKRSHVGGNLIVKRVPARFIFDNNYFNDN